jgi:hypothetical protein
MTLRYGRATQIKDDDMIALGTDQRLLAALSRLCGKFGKRGYPEAKIVLPNGKDTRVYALAEDAAQEVQDARMLLREYGRSVE